MNRNTATPPNRSSRTIRVREGIMPGRSVCHRAVAAGDTGSRRAAPRACAFLIPSDLVSTQTLRRATLSGLNLTFLLTIAHGTNDAFANVLPVFLPTLQARFGLGEAVLAVMVAVISLSANVLQPVFGGFVDGWGRRKTAALGLIIG